MCSNNPASKIFSLGVNILMLAFFSLVSISCKTPSIIATQAIQQGDVANNQNEYELAIQHYTTYLETAPSLGVMRNQKMEADVCRKLAHAYSTQGKYNESLKYLAKGLKIDENEPDNLLNIIEDYRQIGITHVYLGQYAKALNSLNKALDLNSGMESSIKAIKKLSIADTYLSKAQLELTMGLFNECKADAYNSQTIYLKEDREGPGMIEVYLLFGKLMIAENKTDSAGILINKSIDLSKKQDYKIFRQLQVLGDIQLQIGQPGDAILTKEEALDEAIAVNIQPQIIWAHIRLGDAYEVIGDTKKANQHYKKAGSLLKSIGQGSSSLNPSLHLRLGDVKNAYDMFNKNGAVLGANIAALKLAESMIMSGETDTLETYILSAHKYFSSQGVVTGQVKADLLLSILYQSQEKYDEALQRLEEAEALNIGPETQWRIWYNKGLIFQSTQDLNAAEKWFEKSVSTIESQRNELTRPDFRWHYLDSKVDVYDSYLTMLLNNEHVSEEMVIKAFSLNERARSRTFLDMLANQTIGDTKTGSAVSREQALGNEIVFLKNQIEYTQLKGNKTEYFELKLNDIHKEYSSVLDEIEQGNPEYAALKTIDPVSLNDIMESLDGQTALLEFWVGKNGTVTWKIDNSGISFRMIGVDKDSLSRSVTKTRNLVKFNVEDEVLDGFRELYEILSPVFQNVFDDYQTVGIIPHGPLHFIPFEALFGEDKFIVEKVDMFYAPSASIYHYCNSRVEASGEKSLFGLALGKLRLGHYSSLPGTAMELQQLSQFYEKNQCVYESEISESYFKEAAVNYDLIHIATHGVMNTYNPGKSFILMAPGENDDGQLTVEEIFDLDLNSQFVTLSACETGLGDLSNGDELIGLSRAFIYAGTSSVIVSLWKVDDISTSILMTKMHQLVDAGLPVAAALSQAQRDLITGNFNPRASRGMQSIEWDDRLKSVVNSKETRYASPYFWAPFIVIGSPGSR